MVAIITARIMDYCSKKMIGRIQTMRCPSQRPCHVIREYQSDLNTSSF